MGGFLLGLLALAALARVVRSDSASSRVGSLFGVPAEVASRFLDPNVPAVGAAHDAATGTTTARPPLGGAAPATAYPKPTSVPAPAQRTA